MPTSVAPRRIRVNGAPSSTRTVTTGSRTFHGWAMTTTVSRLQKPLAGLVRAGRNTGHASTREPSTASNAGRNVRL